MAEAETKVEPNPITCLTAILWAVLVQPLWYVLLFGILRTIEAEPYLWVCYWLYVPTGFVVGFLTNTRRVKESKPCQ